MVSTRQMSTAVSSSHGDPTVANNDDTPPNTRLSVITRQSSYNGTSCNAGVASGSCSSRTTANSPTASNHFQKHSSTNSGVIPTVTGGVSVQSGIASTSSPSSNRNEQKILLLDLPIEILDKIFSYVTYKKVGQMRVISRQMNQICSTILNSTFSRLQTQMSNRFQTVKAMMPRRESARRNHPLACECDIIETCHMRLSLLQMTFGKHIERKHCCFFPGGILDEVYYVLNYIRTTPKLERPYKVTDELFDLSTMAMEYFKEHIEPNLPEIVYFSKDFFNITLKNKQTFSIKAAADISESSSSSPPQSNMVLRKGIRKIKQGMKIYNNQLTVLRSELRNCKRKSTEQGKQIAEQQKLLADQQKQTLEYANRLDENDRKNEEISRKFSTLLQELNKCKTELQYWRSKSPAVQVCTSCGHKITPAVAPEEYQALVNQGVKLQDINISLDDVDDSDTSSNVFSDLGLDNQSTKEFVFPDEATTARLLATSTSTTTAAATTVTVSDDNVISTNVPTAISSNNNFGNTTNSKRRFDGIIKSHITSTSTTTTSTFLNNMSILDSSDNKMNTAQPSEGYVKPNLAAGSGRCNDISNDGVISSSMLFTSTTQLSLRNNDGINNVPLTPSTLSLNSNSLSSDTKKARKVQNKGSRCHINNKRNK